ncbi:hypothetical protein M0R45_026941 [Rubus argutus]|uniref:Dienelactone hydrolase domain-containing protein n=1 Tax=Rubus argutus TaxID=59490 RepID=A0AAW1X0P8_RUBAR
MTDFNNFITDTNLCDTPLQNAEFTWSNNMENAIWCRLDRFLFSTEWEDNFPDVRQLALPRVTSDHCPVLLDTIKVKWGPTPFRFENIWLEHHLFKDNFKNWWGEESVFGWEGFKFMRKLRGLKEKIKVWSKETFGNVGGEKRELEELIKQLDTEEKSDNLCVLKRNQREAARERLEHLVFQDEIRWRQKAKLACAKEGDGNTRLFHKVVNGRRKRNFIEKIEVANGLVVEDELIIEQEIISFYEKLYTSTFEGNWGKVAASGFCVVVPDFFYGDPFVYDNNKPLAVWLEDHGTDKGFEDAKSVIDALKGKGFSAIGAAGFCWGAKVVTELANSEFIQAAVLLHPSSIGPDDIEGMGSTA